MPVPTPNPAATLILARDLPRGGGYEVFLVKRHSRAGFMADAHVFPGGRVDETDQHPDAAALCDGLDVAGENLPDLPLASAVGYHLAALRELFEEVGVLFGREADGRLITFVDPERKLKFDAYRTAVHQGMLPLPMIFVEEKLRFALDAFVSWSHWVTPAIESRRFDTRFFVAQAPEGQVPLHDSQETTQSEWLTPAGALERYRAHAIHLAPPTLRTLEELSEYSSVAALMRAARQRSVVRIQPHFVEEGGLLKILLPGDPDYPDRSASPVSGASRIVMEEGRWWSRHSPG